MRKFSTIYKEYDTLAEWFSEEKDSKLLKHIIDKMVELDKEMVNIKKKQPYGGICEDCGKETNEFCHNHLCVSCCSKRNSMYEEEYE